MMAKQTMTEQTFEDWMKSVQFEMEQALATYLPAADAVPARLHEAMRYAVLDGGKRMRPLLVFAAGEMFGAKRSALARAGAAVEMIHAYSLVHDDMPCMDDDALRRGKPTVHVKYDEATALLVGDALQSQAFLVLSEGEDENDEISPARKLDMLRLLARASGSTGMCGGQAIDLASVGVSLSLNELEQMHRLKTGALLRASVMLGALCGTPLAPKGAALDALDALDDYAQAIGLAFQVVDDVLDATADSAVLGKSVGKDAADNKPTYVSILGLERSRALAEKLRNDAYRAVEQFGAVEQFNNKAQRLRELADLIVRRKT